MKHLENIGEVGRGIAVAFVATVYGVASANLLLLPAGMKIRSRAALERRRCELMMEGVIAIAEGMNPHLIRAKLGNYRSGKAAAPAPQKAPLVSQPAAAAAGRV
jgi:chemotaxis protein MotA